MSADGFVTNDLWFASSLAYIFGGESLTIIEVGKSIGRVRTKGFHFDVPSLDAEEYDKEFREGRLAISDLMAFTKEYSRILRLLKDLDRRGEISWTSPSWVTGRGR